MVLILDDYRGRSAPTLPTRSEGICAGFTSAPIADRSNNSVREHSQHSGAWLPPKCLVASAALLHTLALLNGCLEFCRRLRGPGLYWVANCAVARAAFTVVTPPGRLEPGLALMILTSLQLVFVQS